MLDTPVRYKQVSPLNYLPCDCYILEYIPSSTSGDILHVKFYQYRFGGVALTRKMDRQIDRVIPIYHPKVC